MWYPRLKRTGDLRSQLKNVSRRVEIPSGFKGSRVPGFVNAQKRQLDIGEVERLLKALIKSIENKYLNP